MLDAWSSVVRATADWITAYACQRNATMSAFDLGPLMYVVSEDTGPNATCNLVFELANWRLGLEPAGVWMERLGSGVGGGAGGVDGGPGQPRAAPCRGWAVCGLRGDPERLLRHATIYEWSPCVGELVVRLASANGRREPRHGEGDSAENTVGKLEHKQLLRVSV